MIGLPAEDGPGSRGTRDPGLQPERTRLAWRRTTLSCAVVCVLAARASVRDGATAAGLVALALCALPCSALLLVAHGRTRDLSAGERPSALAPAAASTAVWCVVSLGFFGALLVLL
ncbi:MULTISPECIES: DUF202 domain-containing protein [unclassified Streptomyces]|uniref:DUF202 domain-containing protein n=1 Tax=unclassified Streptomyces TaxID=2593676 RepID=UPI003221D194